MTKALILVISLVALAIAIGGCTTASPSPSPTAQIATPTASAVTPTPPAATPTAEAPSSATVSIQGSSFKPETVTVAKGGTVTWTNDENLAHTVKFADGQSPTLQKGSTFSKKFDAAGTFDYSCGIHPGMHGTVKVV